MGCEVSTHCNAPVLSFTSEAVAGEMAQCAKHLPHKCGQTRALTHGFRGSSFGRLTLLLSRKTEYRGRSERW